MMYKNKVFFGMAIVLGMMFMFTPQIHGQFSFDDNGVFSWFRLGDDNLDPSEGIAQSSGSGEPSTLASPSSLDEGVPPVCCDEDAISTCYGGSVRSCTLNKCGKDNGDGTFEGYYLELSAECPNGCASNGVDNAKCYDENDFDTFDEWHGCVTTGGGAKAGATSYAVNKPSGEDYVNTQDCTSTGQRCVLGSPPGVGTSGCI